MNTTATRLKTGCRKVGGLTLMIALAALIAGLPAAMPARADEDHGRRDAPHDRDHADRRREEHRPAPRHHEEPTYVYAPPAVYYAPPPPPTGLSLIIPLYFR
jgi:hypothetical protein